MTKKTKELPQLDEFFCVVPREVLLSRFSPTELKQFDDYMIGQTIALLQEQGGYYVADVARFLNYRRKGLTGKKMPLED